MRPEIFRKGEERGPVRSAVNPVARFQRRAEGDNNMAKILRIGTRVVLPAVPRDGIPEECGRILSVDRRAGVYTVVVDEVDRGPDDPDGLREVPIRGAGVRAQSNDWTESERQGAGRRFWFDDDVAAASFERQRGKTHFVKREGRTVWVSIAWKTTGRDDLRRRIAAQLAGRDEA